MKKKLSIKRHQHERGQSLVELTLIIMILLLLVTIAADLGWTFFTMVSLRDAAQEGSITGSICPDDTDVIRDRVRDSTTHPADVQFLLDGDIVIDYLDATTGASKNLATVVAGDKIQVTVHYTHQLFTPFLSVFVGGQSYPLTAESTSTILVTTCELTS